MTFELWFSYFFRIERHTLEVLFLTLLFCKGHRHRNRYVFRLLGWLIVTLAFSGLAGLLYAYSAETSLQVLCKCFCFLASFSVASAVSFACYDENKQELLICAESGIAAQCVTSNIAAILFSDLRTWIVAWGFSDGMLSTFLYQLMYYVCNLPFYVIIFLLFIWKGQKIPEREKSYLFLPLSFSVLILDSVLSSLIQSYADESFALAIIAECFAIFCGVFVLVLNHSLAKLLVTREDLRIAEMLQYQEQKQYEQLKSNMDMINIKCHDIKHFVNSYGGKIGNDEAASLARLVSSFDSYVETNNETLNTILNEKAFVCERKGIDFVCMGDASELSFMKAADIYSLFGNAMDNAIEGVERLENGDSDKKKINLSLWREGSDIVLNVMNYCKEDLRQQNGIYRTSKDDKSYHGFGMLSMDTVAKKYGGKLTADVTGGVFSLTVCIPVPHSEEGKSTVPEPPSVPVA